jgi:hypothetical protein
MRHLTIIVAFVIGCVLAGIAAVLYVDSQSPRIPTEHTVRIVDGNAIVNAEPPPANSGAEPYTEYKISVPSGATNISISGTFTAEGSSGNDIKVYVFDSNDYQRWQLSEDFASIYQSGQTHTGSISASINSSGTYYLLLDNELDNEFPTSAKTVTFQATLTYTK